MAAKDRVAMAKQGSSKQRNLVTAPSKTQLQVPQSNSDKENQSNNHAWTAAGALSWRMPRKTSHSDYTIEIKYLGPRKDCYGNMHVMTKYYHVHKCVIAVGPRKAGFFDSLFTSGGSVPLGNAAHGSSYSFHALVAIAFPQFLDYVYASSAPLNITTETATALYFLAKHFDVQPMLSEAHVFWKRNIESAYTCGTYYKHAYLLQQDDIFQVATSVCCDKVWSLPKTSQLLHLPHFSFWLKLAARGPLSTKHLNDYIPSTGNSSNGDDTKLFVSFVSGEYSRRLSILIVEFCRIHLSTMNKATFQMLTSARSLPVIDIKAALGMMELERQLVAATDRATMSSLQERCIDAVARDWHRIDVAQRVDVIKTLRKQCAMCLEELLVRVMAVVEEQCLYERVSSV
ncbi:hypothetical protein MPSEU_000361600 [Mayamaea pseudoterrestris]|nr:hypothetical protein MPSEU_000361600 [Mayamaea pseudoterrestris]